jgi:hypothetical protein
MDQPVTTPHTEPARRAYGLGWITGIACFLAVSWAFRAATVSQPLRVAWTPSVVDWVDEPLLQGQSRRLTQEIQNHGRGTVRLDELVCRTAFVRLLDPPAEQFPLKLHPGTSRTVTWEITPEATTWGVQEVELFSRVRNQTEEQPLRCILALQAAGWVNPDPNHWSFGRVSESTTPPVGRIRLWNPVRETVPEPCVVTSTDPAVTIRTLPLELVEQGRHYFQELEVRIDPRRAQSRHRSYLEVTSAGKPPVQIAILGWSDAAPSTEAP